ncbi:hypothetical protein ACFY1B_42865 [Streptomyces mirabilis]|uniref:hypothetical protein n=1 Tax=Streptomyces mirabilis TaxID=68239 RepID=UPI0036BA8A7E
MRLQSPRTENPGQQPDSWGARGLRPGWEMEWPAARAGLWHNPVSWTIRSDYPL